MTHPTVYLIRHGQSQANVGGITLENPVVPLTELGELQARTSGDLATGDGLRNLVVPLQTSAGHGRTVLRPTGAVGSHPR